MTYDERIADAVESGQRAATIKVHQLVSDALAAIAHQYAIPVGELLQVVKDGMKDE